MYREIKQLGHSHTADQKGSSLRMSDTSGLILTNRLGAISLSVCLSSPVYELLEQKGYTLFAFCFSILPLCTVTSAYQVYSTSQRNAETGGISKAWNNTQISLLIKLLYFQKHMERSSSYIKQVPLAGCGEQEQYLPYDGVSFSMAQGALSVTQSIPKDW